MNVRSQTVKLMAEDEAFVALKVESGAYADADEVVSAAIRALREREENLERLIREEVLPAHDRLLANPETALSADEVFGWLRARHDDRARREK